MVEVSLTVGKVDASLAILTTSDHYVIEFPTVLLPENVEAGSVVKISVEQDLEQEKEQKRKFESVQEQILSKYGSDPPSEPVLHLLNATQTSCVINWDPIHLGSSQLKSLILYKQGNRHLVLTQDAWGKQQENGHGANPWELENDQHNTLKVSGLSVDVEYEFQLLLNTTSGKFWSNVLKVHTHKMTDMSGITVCVGPNTVLDGTATREQIKRSLSKIGANPLQDHVTLETTHFVAVELQDNDEELARARNNNIPIVRPEWVKACELEKRIVGVRDFYLDSAPDTFSQYKFTDESAETEPALETVREESVEQPVEQPVEESVKEPVEESVKEPVEEPVEAKEGTVEVPIDAPAEPTTDTTESNDVQESEIPVEEPEKTEQPAEQFDEVPIENTSEPAEQLDEVPIEQPEDVSEATPVEKISEETPADEAPKETPVEEAPKETPIEEAPEETPVVEIPKETPIEETPNETQTEEAPEETAAEEAPEETPAEKAPEETAAEEAPEETAAEEAPNTNPAEVESGEESEVQVDNTEETSPEAVETENKPSSAPASSSSSKKKNKKKKKGKK